MALVFCATFAACVPSAFAEVPLSEKAQAELSQFLTPTDARPPQDALSAPGSPLAPVAIDFDQAIARAQTYGAASLLAQTDTQRLVALVVQARAASLPTLALFATYNRLDNDRVLVQGDTTRLLTGANQVSGNATLTLPLLAPSKWAAWLHAKDNVQVGQLSQQDAKNKAAQAAARAYLLVCAQKRLTELSARAHATAQEHLAHAQTRLDGGLGNRLDVARAQAEAFVTLGQFHNAQALLRKSQELLGAVLAHDGPLDALRTPPLAPPLFDLDEAPKALLIRSDLRLLQANAWAAARLLRHRFVDWLPTVSGTFAPFFQDPPSLVQPALGWQARMDVSWVLYDGGLRYGQTAEREALYHRAKTALWTASLEARAEVRAARFAVRSAEQAAIAAKAAEQAATQAAHIAKAAFLGGVFANLEALDAERRARDACTQAAQAQDALVHAKLDLLIALGQFPIPP
ncbi:MAG TPA: TolC family protein [Pseudomonadota bacterium]|nr:TolC family protein [Pseudomonadota bacterium]